MQLEMTEQEFRVKLSARAVGHPADIRPDGQTISAAVDIVREAGMEFAPEIVERLVFQDDGAYDPSRGPKSVGAWALRTCVGFHQGEAAARQLLRRVVERDTAYPGLRKAAERLTALITPSVSVDGCEIQPLRDALSDLRDELAKGPKG